MDCFELQYKVLFYIRKDLSVFCVSNTFSVQYVLISFLGISIILCWLLSFLHGFSHYWSFVSIFCIIFLMSILYFTDLGFFNESLFFIASYTIFKNVTIALCVSLIFFLRILLPWSVFIGSHFASFFLWSPWPFPRSSESRK